MKFNIILLRCCDDNEQIIIRDVRDQVKMIIEILTKPINDLKFCATKKLNFSGKLLPRRVLI